MRFPHHPLPTPNLQVNPWDASSCPMSMKSPRPKGSTPPIATAIPSLSSPPSQPLPALQLVGKKSMFMVLFTIFPSFLHREQRSRWPPSPSLPFFAIPGWKNPLLSQPEHHHQVSALDTGIPPGRMGLRVQMDLGGSSLLPAQCDTPLKSIEVPMATTCPSTPC